MGSKASGYDKITSLCLASNELGSATGHLLKEVLWGERAPCALQTLDLSQNVELTGGDLALALRRNESLTSIDLRGIPSANTDSVYNSIGALLLQAECQCRLGFLSCGCQPSVRLHLRRLQQLLAVRTMDPPISDVPHTC